MMGRQNMLPDNLFLYNICLEDRIRKDHPLRRIKGLIDFDFIYNEVKDRYGRNSQCIGTTPCYT